MMKTVTNYFRQSVNELSLVTWPKQDELVHMTILTVIVVLISALLLGAVDFGLTTAYQWLLGLNG